MGLRTSNWSERWGITVRGYHSSMGDRLLPTHAASPAPAAERIPNRARFECRMELDLGATAGWSSGGFAAINAARQARIGAQSGFEMRVREPLRWMRNVNAQRALRLHACAGTRPRYRRAAPQQRSTASRFRSRLVAGSARRCAGQRHGR